MKAETLSEMFIKMNSEEQAETLSLVWEKMQAWGAGGAARQCAIIREKMDKDAASLIEELTDPKEDWEATLAAPARSCCETFVNEEHDAECQWITVRGLESDCEKEAVCDVEIRECCPTLISCYHDDDCEQRLLVTESCCDNWIVCGEHDESCSKNVKVDPVLSKISIGMLQDINPVCDECKGTGIWTNPANMAESPCSFGCKPS